MPFSLICIGMKLVSAYGANAWLRKLSIGNGLGNFVHAPCAAGPAVAPTAKARDPFKENSHHAQRKRDPSRAKIATHISKYTYMFIFECI